MSDLDPVHFHGIVVAPDAWRPPLRMVGRRPTDEEWAAELCEIYGIHSDDCRREACSGWIGARRWRCYAATSTGVSGHDRSRGCATGDVNRSSVSGAVAPIPVRGYAAMTDQDGTFRTICFDYTLPEGVSWEAFEDRAGDWFFAEAQRAGGQCEGGGSGPYTDRLDAYDGLLDRALDRERAIRAEGRSDADLTLLSDLRVALRDTLAMLADERGELPPETRALREAGKKRLRNAVRHAQRRKRRSDMAAARMARERDAARAAAQTLMRHANLAAETLDGVSGYLPVMGLAPAATLAAARLRLVVQECRSSMGGDL